MSMRDWSDLETWFAKVDQVLEEWESVKDGEVKT